MVEEHGFTFIGPTPEHIRMMGDKITAKKAVRPASACRWCPAPTGAVTTLDRGARRLAKGIGYPVLIKATAGGGGKGMKIAHTADEIESAWSLAKSEARAAFGDDSVYMEKYLGRPRHIEIQILADTHGKRGAFRRARLARSSAGTRR